MILMDIQRMAIVGECLAVYGLRPVLSGLPRREVFSYTFRLLQGMCCWCVALIRHKLWCTLVMELHTDFVDHQQSEQLGCVSSPSRTI